MITTIADAARYAQACAAYQRVMQCSQNVPVAIAAYDAEMAS